MITHAGILKDTNDQSTFAHSPEPLKTISRTSANGKVESIKSKPGPHPGTWSLGRFCNQTCLDATAIPVVAVTVKKKLASNLAILLLGSIIEQNKKIMPTEITANLWNMHKGQGSRSSTYCA